MLSPNILEKQINKLFKYRNLWEKLVDVGEINVEEEKIECPLVGMWEYNIMHEVLVLDRGLES